MENYLRHTQFTRDSLISVTPNQAETFYSMLVVRQIKNIVKIPKGFMECMVVII